MNNNKNLGTVRSVEGQSLNDGKPQRKKNNIVPKILCVVAAFFLWLYVMQTESPEYSETISSVSVDISNSAELQQSSGFSVYGKSGNVVDVKVTGKKSVISRLDKEDIHAYIDVSKIKEAGQHALPVFVELPDGLDLVVPEPKTISVYVDETDTVSLPVNEKLENFELVTPYELGEVRFEYDSITVTGPKKKLSELSAAQVTVNMNNKTSSFTSLCPVDLIDINGKKADMSYLVTSASEINVTVPIYVTKEVPIETIFKHGFLNANNAKVTVSPATLTVKGDESQFSDAKSVFDPYVIDEKLISDSIYNVVYRAQTNANVIIDEESTEIKISVVLDDSLKTKQFTTTDIQVKGVQPNINYEVLDKEVTVTLRGTADELAEITPADISVILDLSGLDASSKGNIVKAATVKIDSSKDSKVYEVGYYTVQLKIS